MRAAPCRNVQRLVGEVLEEVGLPEDVRRVIEPMGGKIQSDFGRPYHTLQRGGAFHFTLETQTPVTSRAQVTPVVGVADSRDERFAFIVMDGNRPATPPLMLRTDDLHPGTTAAAEARIRSWVTEVWARACPNCKADLKSVSGNKGSGLSHVGSRAARGVAVVQPRGARAITSAQTLPGLPAISAVRTRNPRAFAPARTSRRNAAGSVVCSKATPCASRRDNTPSA